MSNLRKALALVLVFALIISMPAFVSAANFADVPVGSTHAEAINLLKTLGIVGGQPDGSFHPEASVTRAEFAKILYGIFNGNSNASVYVGPSAFDDVSTDSWYVGYVNWASDLGIIDGKGNNKFAPDDKVTYYEATKMYIVALTNKINLSWPFGFVNVAKRTNINLFLDINISDMNSAANRADICQMGMQSIFATDCARFYTYNMDGTVATKSTAAKDIFEIKPLYTQLLGSSNDPLEQAVTSSGKVVFPQSIADAANGVSGVVADQLTYKGNVAGLAKHNVVVWYKDIDDNYLLDTTDTIVYIADGVNKTVTFKSSDATIDQTTGQLYAMIDGVKTLMKREDVSTSTNPLPYVYYNGKGYGSTGARIVLTPDVFASFFGKKDNFTVTLLSTGLTDSGLNTGVWTYAFVDQPVNGLKIIALDAANGLVTLDKLGTLSTKTGATKATIYDNAAVGDYVNATLTTDYTNTINGMKQGSTYHLKKADVLSHQILQTSSTVKGVTYYTIGGKQCAINDRSYADGLTGLGTVGELCNAYLDSAGNVVAYESLNTEVSTDLGNFILITDVSVSKSMLGPVATVQGVLDDGTTVSYKLAPEGQYLDPDGTNIWFDPVKGFFDGNVYSEVDPTDFVYDNTKMLGNVFRYELDVTDPTYISKLESVSRIQSNVGLRENDEFVPASDITSFDYDATNKTFSFATKSDSTLKIRGFLSDDAVIYQYDDITDPANPTIRVIKPEDLQSISSDGAVGGTLFGGNNGGIYIDRTTLTPAIAFVTIGKLGTAAFKEGTSSIAAVLSVSEVAGSARGYMAIEASMMVDGKVNTYKTTEFSTASKASNSFTTALVAGQFAQVDFDGAGAIDAAVKAYSPSASGWATGYIKSLPKKEGGYYGINKAQYADEKTPNIINPGLIDLNEMNGEDDDYYKLADDVKVYTISDYAVPDTGANFRTDFYEDTLDVGSVGDLCSSSQYSNYVVDYHYTVLADNTLEIDTIFVYTEPVEKAEFNSTVTNAG
ncbi:MAG: S-layer homology domain-containing protein [Bacillota bacterium]|nr:S-layer homology domain-containing protein [Bacillota bacterium]